MKALLLAAAIILPPEVLGVWSADEGRKLVELDQGGAAISVYDGSSIATVECEYLAQVPGMFGYALSCSDGMDRVLEFYDTGVMNLDGVRYNYGD